METYTAEELAGRARRELGAEVNPRTIYFYRQIGVLSPLEAGETAGGQARFAERHFLELAAALALQRAPDRPTLTEIAAMLRGLSEEGLRELARAVGPTARELVAGGLARPSAGPRPQRPPRQSPQDPPGRERFALLNEEPGIFTAAPSGPAPPSSSPGASLGAEPARATPPYWSAPAAVTINLAPGVTLHVGPEAPRDLVARVLEVALSQGRPAPEPPRPEPPRTKPERATQRKRKADSGQDAAADNTDGETKL